MNKNRNLILMILLSVGLTACTTTSQIDKETTPEPEKPEVVEPEVLEPVEPKPEEKPVEPEPKPEEKPAEKPKPAPKKTEDGKLILGDQEWVYIPGLKQSFKARVDTGATTSSLSAQDIVQFERDGKDWVKFKMDMGDTVSKEIALPIQRWVKIRQASSEETDKRPVIVAWVQVGDLKEKTEFTLSDREHMKFSILLGRSFFKDVAVVDVSKKYVQDKYK
ncbi:ATP-dependent zinc protease [Vibrio sp. 10N.261.55.A7]|uniref:ATP-dependent zinc protease family protein n=1 Tax=Vibrio sp. 10N.261.55.A7 TaxID=1880851 RepID=UPI000C838C35|nr:ATP-dependent zinc protease [Vibrio sp. 10N.261.55.A7]PMJ98391.1 ATP-dependent Zn protease [Vibrio sp. 10N.261.55.A7]